MSFFVLFKVEKSLMKLAAVEEGSKKYGL